MKSKQNLFVSSVAALLTLLAFTGCGGGSNSDASSGAAADPTPTDGSQSKTDLSGYGYTCGTFTSAAGTSLNGKAFDRYIQLNADGTYSFSVHITEGTACTSGHPSGTGYSTVDAQVNASGTWTVGGTNTTPSTSTKVTFTPSSFTWTIYNPQTVATAADLVTWANSQCGSWGSTFSTGASSTKTFTPTSCSGTATVSLGTPETLGVTQTNIAYRSSTVSLQMGALTGMWSPNAGSYPSSYSATWTH